MILLSMVIILAKLLFFFHKPPLSHPYILPRHTDKRHKISPNHFRSTANKFNKEQKKERPQKRPFSEYEFVLRKLFFRITQRRSQEQRL